MADIKFGRYKTVVASLVIVAVSIATCGALGLSFYIGLVGFSANVIQFGMDQLHDSPGEDRTLFIHWYVWVFYTSSFLIQLAFNFIIVSAPFSIAFMILTFFLVTVVLPITLCFVQRRRRWFLIEPGALNPYRLVCRITKFAYQHKVPLRRSAFTYCEDEIPTGLDLGKEKYGGCFTTEEVEDVKTFYGILKVLFSFGLVFFLDLAVNSLLSLFASNYFYDYDFYDQKISVKIILIDSGLLSSLMIVTAMPVYLCLIHPFISNYIPGMLKRMGFGMLLLVISLITSFSMDIFIYKLQSENSTDHCMFVDLGLYHTPESIIFTTKTISPAFLTIQFVLGALSHMLIYTAVFEFIWLPESSLHEGPAHRPALCHQRTLPSHSQSSCNTVHSKEVTSPHL